LSCGNFAWQARQAAPKIEWGRDNLRAPKNAYPLRRRAACKPITRIKGWVEKSKRPTGVSSDQPGIFKNMSQA
jgi:hypothetical protein